MDCGPPPGDVNDRHSRCWTQKSYGGTGGLQYLFPQPAHFEILPTIFARLNGAVSCTIGGGGDGGGGEKSAYQSWYDGIHDAPGDMQDGPGVINEGFGG